MAEACIIIGGGVSGLSAAVRLAELGIQPLLLEAGKYPGHRICGEFFSPECLPILERWGIEPQATIQECHFIFGRQEIHFTLPKAAGGLSRYSFDQQLLKLAQKKGAKVLTEAVVDQLKIREEGQEFYEVHLANGERHQAKKLMIGTGRLPQLSQLQKPIYAGFKRHFEGIDLPNALEMHCFKGGYIGLSPIAPGMINVAGLVKLDKVEDLPSFLASLPMFLGMDKRFKTARPLFKEWLKGNVPEFGIRQNPTWPGVFWIGDAAGSIPPICGDGLGIALTTGIMAAEYLVLHNEEAFRRDWLKRYKGRFFWGKWLHQGIMNPIISRMGVYFCQLFPSFPKQLFALTRE